MPSHRHRGRARRLIRPPRPGGSREESVRLARVTHADDDCWPAGPDAGSAADPPPRARAAPDLHRGGGRHRLEGRAAARQRPGHGERRDERRHPEFSGHQLRRAAALGAGHEHHADLGARLQHQHARRHLHALDVAAGAHRRPQPLPRLLRLRRLGLPAGEPERDPADRGHPRPGLGRVGRQCALGRRQLHHQDAARDGRHELHDGRGQLRPRRQRQRPQQRRALVLQRHARGGGQRSLGLQDLGRRAGAGRPAAARRAPSTTRSRRRIRSSPTPARASRSSMRASTTTRPRAPTACRSPAASPAPKASSTPASARST